MAFALDGPTSITVLQGGHAVAIYRVLATSRPYRNVTLRITGLPSGVMAEFSPWSGKPSFQTTLTLVSSSTSAIGTFTLTLTARDAKGSKTMPVVFRNYTVNIPPPPPAPGGGGFDPVKAFPSAEGFGASETIHARSASASVLHVTNLNDSGAGSLRAALTASGSRYIVFDVSGDITLSTPIVTGNGNFYLAGQTSPGGVQLRGFDTNITLRGSNCHNIVVRHMRVRPGGGTGNNGQCIIIYGGDGEVTKVIVDHCSLMWSSDTLFQFYQPHNLCTIQWCLIAEGSNHASDPDLRGKGIHLGKSTTSNESIHHNIFAHLFGRVPLAQQSGVGDHRNNVIYNWQGSTRSEFGTWGGGSGEAYKGNVVKNLFIPGNDSSYPGSGLFWLENGANNPCSTLDRGGTKLYLSGNEVSGVGGFTWGNSIIRDGDPVRCGTGPDTTATEAEFGTTEFTAPAITEHTVATLKAALTAAHGVGAWATVEGGGRDSADQNVIDDVNDGTGNILTGLSGTYPTLSGGSPPTDSDSDGVPDSYCNAHGLNPNGNIALTFAPNGYQWIENYLNELAGDTIQY